MMKKQLFKYISYAFIFIGIFMILNSVISGPQAYDLKWYTVIGNIFAGIILIVTGIYGLKQVYKKTN
jgi:hypothetical protein